MLSTEGPSDTDDAGTPPILVDSSLDQYLVPLDERRLNRVMTIEPGPNSSGPLYESPTWLQPDYSGMVNLNPTKTLRPTMEFLMEIRGIPALRLLKLSGDQSTGLTLTIRHIRPSELCGTLATMETVREVLNQYGALTVELESSDSRSA